MVIEGMRLVLEPRNYPLLVMCNAGSHQTGTFVGCLRKLQRWTLSSILEEFRRYVGTSRSRSRLMNEQFIELFDVDLIHVPEGAPSTLRL